MEQWLETQLNLYADRVLPVTANAARHWGRLSAGLGHDGADLLIAAAALTHGQRRAALLRRKPAARRARMGLPRCGDAAVSEVIAALDADGDRFRACSS